MFVKRTSDLLFGVSLFLNRVVFFAVNVENVILLVSEQHFSLVLRYILFKC